ncbi:aldo/keto reductase [Faecalicatena sp. AGMB00832]|uniref:Aldo/keto reductase n=1 Tax=Faecalicatena faecalis TaxID=2726362 RepID=A0ABS6D083_9FIRM|nr:aldo/keto reductase [Faecalicatena faecalis]MBU3874905.1 aldo/keto reductase [Faecalicatena faecalis]
MNTKLEYVEIPYVKKKVSRIIYGTAIPPFMTGEGKLDLLDAVYAMGVNTFDLARVYQLAETSVGRWLEARGNRQDVVLLSKCGHPSPSGEKRVNEKEMRKDFKKSTEELHTDYIDIYLLHRDDPEIEAGVAVEIFNAMHAEGKIGAFGGSNWTHERIEQANEYAYKHNLIPFTVSSPHFGLADQVLDPWGGGCVTISGPANERARKWYQENQMPVIAYSSLAHGLFSGQVKSSNIEHAGNVLDEPAMKGYAYPENFERLRRCEELAKAKGASVPQIAMAWIYQQKLNTFAVVSTSKAERMQENIDALQIELSEEEIAYLDLR